MFNRQMQFKKITWIVPFLLIMGITAHLQAAVFPPSLPVSDTTVDYKSLTLVITNEILKSGGSTNAGVNYLKIIKPTAFRWPSTIVLTNNNPTNYSIRIRDYYDNNVSIRTLVNNKWWTNLTSFLSGANRAMIRTNGDEIYIILSSQITNMSVASREHLYIDMRFYVTNFTAAQFDSYVQAMKLRDMTVKRSNYSTCGWQKSTGTASVLLEEGPAKAYASINPESVYVGQGTYNFTYYFSTEDVFGRQDITWAAIEIPRQFTNARFTNFTSVRLGTNAKYYVKCTNITALDPAKRFIRINYTSALIPSPDGLDVLTFNVLGNVTSGTGKWNSWVEGGSSLSSSTSSTTFNNANYPSKLCEVMLEGPSEAYGSISPSITYAGSQDYTLTYYFSTAGITGKQDIKWAAIEIPDIFTNASITNFDSVVMGTNERQLIKKTNISALSTKRCIRLNYSGSVIASPDGLDVITFHALGNVSTGTGVWRSWVEGGSSLNASSKATTNNVDFPSKQVIVNPESPAEGFASVSPILIYQGPNSYNFTYYFSTTGVLQGRQDISWAAIEIPDQFTNASITNFNSVLMGTNERNLIKVTNGIPGLTTKKVIKMNYSGDKIGSPNGLDVLSFQILGSVTKGYGRWKSWVDGVSLSGSSLETGTNVNYPSQVCLVSGETPKVDAEITQPSSGDPRVLFNSITKSTLEYKLRNTSANIDNKIYDAII
ncbi:MAG: hypothetical protein PHF84_05075, partial [bacterium]|nr:hypothetical protein [bacterium]